MLSSEYQPSETLHRLVKQVIDSGAATNIAAAEEIFRGYKIAITIGESESSDVNHQVCFLTAVALARRVFLGGASVSGALHVKHLTPLPIAGTLAQAVVSLGGTVAAPGANCPTITIGGSAAERKDSFHVRTAYAGWRGGIIPAHREGSPTGPSAMPLAASLAAALAVNEAFLHVSGKTPAAGKRSVGLSLWNPERKVDWLSQQADEPELQYLPTKLWLIGLGHLGQSFLWALGLLPYPEVGPHLVLQDVDVITPATESTSILSDSTMFGAKKTRAMAQWAERRGFITAIHERLFHASFRRQAVEPAIALCGLDNALGRQAFDVAGFDFVVEAGLGRGHKDFRTIRLHTLPGMKAASELWTVRETAGEKIEDGEAYKKLLHDGVLDKCGVTLLAGKAVGAPFVGAVAASLAIAEVLRLLHGGRLYQVVDLDLRSVEHRTAVLHSRSFSDLNPGFTMALPRP